jgi:hypothetical protein
MSEDSKFKKPEQYKEAPNLESTLSEKTNAQLEAEVAALDLEAKKMEVEYKKQEMTWRAKDMKKMDREQAKADADYNSKMDEANAKRIATLQFLASRKANQDRCNHRKGGRGPDAVMRGQGDDPNFAVIKHRLPHSEYMVLCQRCGKEWMPANKWNTENGVLKPIPASPGWAEAMNWPCDNSASASSDFRFEKVDA